MIPDTLLNYERNIKEKTTQISCKKGATLTKLLEIIQTKETA